VIDNIVQRFLDHGTVGRSARAALFPILRDAWQTRPALHARLRPPLLAFLADPDAGIRTGALAFWNSALPEQPEQRLRALLADALEGAGPWVRCRVLMYI
jgi:hypothetical protein